MGGFTIKIAIMKYVLILLLFSALQLKGQSIQDSIVMDFPNYIPCNQVIIYLDTVAIDTQTLVANVTPIDYSVLGMSEFPSPDRPDYTRIERNYITLGTPYKEVWIRISLCILANPGVRIYKKHFNLSTNN